MKIVVKPNTKNIKSYINAGVNAFIFAISKFSSCSKVFFSVKEISEIKEKYKDIDIYVQIDKNIFDKDLEELKVILKEIDSLNILGILFYDLAILSLKKSLNFKTPIIWAPNFLVTNYKTIDFYNKSGVDGALISSCITYKDVEEILKHNKSKLFFNIFGYQVMAFSKRYLVTNYFKHIKEEVKYKNVIKEKQKYEIIENETGTFILSSHVLNGMKYLNAFKDYNLNLVLDEISLNHTKFIKVIKIFKEAIETETDLSYKIEELMSNTDLGFLENETIVKVK